MEDQFVFGYHKGAFRVTRICKVAVKKQPVWWRAAVEFIESIRTVPWFKPQDKDKPNPEWFVYKTRIDARNASKDFKRPNPFGNATQAATCGG